jgi:DNA-directed RNA polymerase beta' subunit
MKLKLLDIDRDIRENKVLEVKNANPPIGSKYDPEGLWSEEIFGKIGNRERKNRFGYIDLKSKMFHPQAYDIIKTVSEPTSKIIARKQRYKIIDKKLVPDSANGQTGLMFLIDNIDNIDFTKIAKKDKLSEASYLEKNKDKLLIDKWLVVPPGGIRDIDTTKKDAARTQSEINLHYRGLLFTVTQLEIAEGDDELKEQIIEKVQKVLIQTSKWIKDNLMKGKQGLLRGSMLKKSMDFSTRIILASSPDIKMGEVGLPWHTLMSIYEPLVSYYVYHKDPDKTVLKSLNNALGNDEDNIIDYSEFTKMLQNYGKNSDLVPAEMVELFKGIIREIIKDAVVTVKRDPIVSRNGWFAAKPVITDGKVATLNSMDLGPLGGDCDGDTVAILPLFTREAKETANAKLNPVNAKSKWTDTKTYNKNIYSLELDSVAAIYAATKDG